MRQWLPLTVALALGACGGSSSPASPTTPSTISTATPSNRSPSVNASVSPSFGIATLSNFTFTAIGSDPDEDTLSYQWSFSDGSSGSGSQVSRIYLSEGNYSETVRVTDGRGGTAEASVNVTVASLTGRWRGVWRTFDFTMDLTQTASVVTGTYVDSAGNGRTDPAEPGSINSGGSFTIRMKRGAFGDFYFRGQIDGSGRRAAGSVSGPGLITTYQFTMDKVS